MNDSIVLHTSYYKITKPNGEVFYDKSTFERHIKYSLSPLLDEDLKL